MGPALHDDCVTDPCAGPTTVDGQVRDANLPPFGDDDPPGRASGRGADHGPRARPRETSSAPQPDPLRDERPSREHHGGVTAGQCRKRRRQVRLRPHAKYGPPGGSDVHRGGGARAPTCSVDGDRPEGCAAGAKSSRFDVRGEGRRGVADERPASKRERHRHDPCRPACDGPQGRRSAESGRSDVADSDPVCCALGGRFTREQGRDEDRGRECSRDSHGGRTEYPDDVATPSRSARWVER